MAFNMSPRFYARVLIVIGMALGFLWFTSGFFNDGQFLPTHLWRDTKHSAIVDDHDHRNKDPEARHLYKKNGLLEVNPDAPHPIYELIERGESLWNAKLARQSRTIEQAVLEYKKRYLRDPPLGFDKWWNYTVKHNVQLRDEYDQIFLSLEPFWGLSPEKIEKLREDAQTRNPDFFTITKQPGMNLTAEGNGNFYFAVENQMNLLWEIQDLLPPLKVTYSPHGKLLYLVYWLVIEGIRDNPMQLAHHDWREKLTAAAGMKKSKSCYYRAPTQSTHYA
jgi:hypothetical protein